MSRPDLRPVRLSDRCGRKNRAEDARGHRNLAQPGDDGRIEAAAQANDHSSRARSGDLLPNPVGEVGARVSRVNVSFADDWGLLALFDHAQERVDQRRIELASALALDFGNRFDDRPGRLVRPLLRQRVEHVGHGDDASRKRDV